MTVMPVWIAACLLALTGLYCLAVSRSIFKLILGADLIFKGVVLFCAGLGGLGSDAVVRLAVVVSVMEALFIATGAALALRLTRISGTRDIKKAEEDNAEI